MNRRALLRGAGGLALASAAAGCLSPVQTLNGGPIRPAGGQSVIHRADQPYLNDEYRVRGDRSRRAWLFGESPPRSFFHPSIPEEGLRSLLLSVSQTDFDDEFLLFVEVRMPVDERYFVSPTPFEEPRWTGIREAALPVRRSDATDVEDPSFEGADAIVCTALVRFEADSAPATGTVEVYGEDGALRERIPAERPD
jgi:hypothetical protein